MKRFDKLTMPPASAWNTLSSRKLLHWRIRSFLTGCMNILRWSPTLFKDRDWDASYIYTILQKKIEFQRNELVNANRHESIDGDNRDMTIALNLIERVKMEYYSIEYLDYFDSNFRFESVDNEKQLFTIQEDLICENYDDYLEKYASSVRIVLKEKPNVSKRDLCTWVAMHNEQKAHNLLHRILKERMTNWWN